jgi:hypothetical protein
VVTRGTFLKKDELDLLLRFFVRLRLPCINGDEFVRVPALFITRSPVMMAMTNLGALNFSPQCTSQMMEKSDGGNYRTNLELISFTSK